jgi:tetratricopeptide (TPR) repeat protein
MAERLVVMVSSTILNLPEHRPQVRDACLRLGMFPLMMENLPASDADAIAESLRMVDQSDAYVGIFGHRYGHVPEGHEHSITEMEVDRALERDVPRRLFFMARNHPVTIEDVDTGANAERLSHLKERLGKNHVVLEFASPADLRANVIHSLSELRHPTPGKLHYISDIPTTPAPYIAHPYTLLQTKDLIGRQTELNLLTDWVTKPGTEVHEARVLSIMAIGGMGKSALTWKWFNDVAPHEMRPLAGRLWWSFYESDARFENFIARALAYVSGRASAEVDQLPLVEQEARLLQALDREPFLLVLDGLERILVAYARPDAAYLGDDDVEDRKLAGADSLPAQLAGQHRLRRTADLRAGMFLQRLAQVQASRILVSTRLYPADLQTVTGHPLPGSAVHLLEGLTNDDALTLWRALGVSGSRDELVAMFNTFENYPLLIRALAGEVAGYRATPGDFDHWRATHPEFDPYSLPLIQRKSHVLAFALRGLSEAEARVLHTIAAFRMPASYDSVVALLVGSGKLYSNEPALDATLSDLEDRGLVGWDRRANRYDLHPIVRGVSWRGLPRDVQQSVYEMLATHFQSIPQVDYEDVESLEDITARMELYNAVVQLGRRDEAFNMLDGAFVDVIARLSAWRDLGQLAKLIIDALSDDERLRYLGFYVLAFCEYFSGYPERAKTTFREVIDGLEVFSPSWRHSGDQEGFGLFVALYGTVLSLTGALATGEKTVRQGLLVTRSVPNSPEVEASRIVLARSLSYRGQYGAARRILQRPWKESLKDIGLHRDLEFARIAIAQHDAGEAEQYASSALEVALRYKDIKMQVDAATLYGAAALQLGNLRKAADLLHEAVNLARMHHFPNDEVASLLELARLHQLRNEPDIARRMLHDLGELTERGSYQLTQADALNLFAQLERDAGRLESAILAATDAYRAAWCDGPPFSYHRALEEAQSHLAALDASAPEGLELLEPRDLEMAGEAGSDRIVDEFQTLRHKVTVDPDPLVRAKSVIAIAAEWTMHPDTLPLVRQCATSDTSAAVRETALRAIGAGWPDDSLTEPLLVQLQRNDPAPEVRAAAHQMLDPLGGDAVAQ